MPNVLIVRLSSWFRYIHFVEINFVGLATFGYLHPGPCRCFIYHAYKCSNANNCWHFNIYKHDEFYVQLSCRFLFP